MTKDERDELTKDASAMAYSAIRFSGLYKKLSGQEWDNLAQKLALDIVAIVEELIDEQEELIDMAKETAHCYFVQPSLNPCSAI